MEDDARIPDVPVGDGAPTSGPVGKAAPPTSRAVAMFAIVFVVLALIGGCAWFIGSGTTPVGCNSVAGPTDPGGVPYSRDPDQGCQFVDADGNVLPGQ